MRGQKNKETDKVLQQRLQGVRKLLTTRIRKNQWQEGKIDRNGGVIEHRQSDRLIALIAARHAREISVYLGLSSPGSEGTIFRGAIVKIYQSSIYGFIIYRVRFLK